MEDILEYIKLCIEKYNNSTSINDKTKYIENICLVYVATLALCNELNGISKELECLVKNLFQSDRFAYNVYKNTLSIDIKDMISNKDLSYIYRLFNIIDLDMKNYKRINNSKDSLYKYIGIDEDYNSLIKYLNNKTIYDPNFVSSYYINLKEDDMLLLNNFNIVTYLHEITHSYTKNINNIYSETPSILMEKGLESYYKLGDNNNRIININSMHYISENTSKEYKDRYQSYFMYVVGTIISISFINKYGNDFKTIKSGVDFIKNNYNLDLVNMFNSLNISEIDIYDSFKNKEKILIKK